jgi:hypothetical protein
VWLVDDHDSGARAKRIGAANGDLVHDLTAGDLVRDSDTGALQLVLVLSALLRFGFIRDDLVAAQDDDQLLGGEQSSDSRSTQVSKEDISILAHGADAGEEDVRTVSLCDVAVVFWHVSSHGSFGGQALVVGDLGVVLLEPVDEADLRQGLRSSVGARHSIFHQRSQILSSFLVAFKHLDGVLLFSQRLDGFVKSFLGNWFGVLGVLLFEGRISGQLSIAFGKFGGRTEKRVTISLQHCLIQSQITPVSSYIKETKQTTVPRHV